MDALRNDGNASMPQQVKRPNPWMMMMMMMVCSAVEPVYNDIGLYDTAYITSGILCYRGHVAALLVEALRYKPEGRGFDSRWCHWNFSLT